MDVPWCTMMIQLSEIDGSGGGDRSAEPAGGNYLHPKRDLGGRRPVAHPNGLV